MEKSEQSTQSGKWDKILRIILPVAIVIFLFSPVTFRFEKEVDIYDLVSGEVVEESVFLKGQIIQNNRMPFSQKNYRAEILVDQAFYQFTYDRNDRAKVLVPVTESPSQEAIQLLSEDHREFVILFGTDPETQKGATRFLVYPERSPEEALEFLDEVLRSTNFNQ